MQPEFTVDTATIVYGIAAAVVGLLAWFAQRNLTRIESDVSMKADKEHMEREISLLQSDLKEAREARERDNDRIERAGAERFTEFSSAMRDRINIMERNVEQKLDLILQMMERRK